MWELRNKTKWNSKMICSLFCLYKVGVILCFIVSFYKGQAQNTDEKILKIASFDSIYAGKKIVLEFELKNVKKVALYCHASYGSTLIEGQEHNGKIIFEIPENMIQKSGMIDYQLIEDQKLLYKGSFKVLPSPDITETRIESYLGPPSIIAGRRDYAMMVTIPTDSLDNPVVDGTPVLIKHQFGKIEKVDELETDYFIGWKRLFSYLPSGRILVSAEVNKINSKEFSLEVYPAQATDFVIDSKRQHSYADGNQVATFTTSKINDKYGNIVSNGTLVEFIVKNSENMLLKTYGTTINGVATGYMLHPDHQESWEVTSYVTGMGKSNTIKLDFEPIVDDFLINFKNKNRKVMIGPIQSFMGQIIPDGALIKLHLYKGEKLLETRVTTSRLGYLVFDLEKEFFPEGKYNMTFEGLGITKKVKQIILW